MAEIPSRVAELCTGTCAPEFSYFSLFVYFQTGFLGWLVKCEGLFHNMVFQHVPASLPIVIPCYQLLNWGESAGAGSRIPNFN